MDIKVVGLACGYHGPYTFYKGVKITFAQGTESSSSTSKAATPVPAPAPAAATTTTVPASTTIAGCSTTSSTPSSSTSSPVPGSSSAGAGGGDGDGGGSSTRLSTPASSATGTVQSVVGAFGQNQTGDDPSSSNSNSSSSSNNNNNNNNNKSSNVKPKQTQRKCVSENNSTATGVNNLCNATAAEKDCLRPLVLALGDCFPVRPWSDSPIACLAELRMVWKDRNEQCLLIALRLYFLPENTPAGRNCHGEDEVLAISDKVIVRADDMLGWIAADLEWNWGLRTTYDEESARDAMTTTRHLSKNSSLDFADVDKEKHSGKGCSVAAAAATKDFRMDHQDTNTNCSEVVRLGGLVA